MNYKGLIFIGIEFTVVWLIVTVIVGILSLLIYQLTLFLHRLLINKGIIKWKIGKKFRLIFILLALFVSSYETYTAFFPGDSFYFGEFETITSRKLPKNAKVIKKASSYPGLHGDYSSSALIQLEINDYNNLHEYVQNQKEINKVNEIIWSSEMIDIMKGIDDKNIIYRYVRKIKGEDDRYLFIGFLNDNKRLIIHISIT